MSLPIPPSLFTTTKNIHALSVDCIKLCRELQQITINDVRERLQEVPRSTSYEESIAIAKIEPILIKIQRVWDESKRLIDKFQGRPKDRIKSRLPCCFFQELSSKMNDMDSKLFFAIGEIEKFISNNKIKTPQEYEEELESMKHKILHAS